METLRTGARSAWRASAEHRRQAAAPRATFLIPHQPRWLIDTVCMTTEQWWAALLNGSVGAALTLGGALLIFWLTRKADQKSVRQEKTKEAVAKIEETGLPLRYTDPGSSEEEKVIESVVQLLVLFRIREAKNHPEVAKWAGLQRENLFTTISPNADIRAARLYLPKVIARLSAWAVLDFPKSIFKDSNDPSAHDFSKIDTNWIIESDHYDISIKATRAEASDTSPEVQARVKKAIS